VSNTSSVKKQEAAAPAEGAAPAEAPAAPAGGVEDKLNALFKAVSELQAAVKDLASAMSASAEAQRGLKEALMGDFKAALLEDLKKVVTVGYPAVVAENKPEDKRPAPTPTKKPEAVGEEVSAPPANIQPPHPVYEKSGKVEVVKTERPEVEVKKTNVESPVTDMIREVLGGKLTGQPLVKRLRGVIGQ
jgi:hypothetical protein